MTYQTLLLSGDQGIQQAVKLLQQGECVALPSETVYGLAADAMQPSAVNKIFAAKGRPANHPLIVHIPHVSHVARWARHIPAQLDQLSEAFWPGPLTVLVEKKPEVPNEVTGGLDTIALRVPAHPLFLEVLRSIDTGLAAPSANPYKKLSPTIAEQVDYGLHGRIAAILDGGHCDFGLESTIIDLVSDTPRILRAGPISRQQIEAVLGCPVELPEEHVEVVPGNVKAHYQPATPLIVLSTSELLRQLEVLEGQSCELVIWSQTAKDHCLEMSFDAKRIRVLDNDAQGFGRELYLTLHKADQDHMSQIILEAPPTDEAWRAVNDRLSRAQSKLL
ncbi:L-threonylcarbamoyladenylate synthase [Salinibius halmophilus]|uniref:L-threonylcarbamoyladenylate synthase n=1 Tax=Salinibius halmophilus TaxID=1853216 RepID=UPI0018F3402D|nr:L-threonylcarbamoyladenylate synthase [Salinibius halmophilus]